MIRGLKGTEGIDFYLKRIYGGIRCINEYFTDLIKRISENELSDDYKDYYVRHFKGYVEEIEEIKETLGYYVEEETVQ